MSEVTSFRVSYTFSIYRVLQSRLTHRKKSDFLVSEMCPIINRHSRATHEKNFFVATFWGSFHFECQFYFRWYQLLLELTILFIYRCLNSRGLQMKLRRFFIEDWWWVSGDARYATIGSLRFGDNLYIRLTLRRVDISSRPSSSSRSVRKVTYLDLYLTIMNKYFTTYAKSRTITERDLDFILLWNSIERKIFSYIMSICWRTSWTICERVDVRSGQTMSLFMIVGSRDVKIWAEASSIISMSWNRISRISSPTNGDNEDLNDWDWSIMMITIDDFRWDRCHKIVPVIITTSLHSSKTFSTWCMTAWDHSQTLILSDTRNNIQDRIGISVRSGTFHEMRKRSEIMKCKLKKNRRDNRKSTSGPAGPPGLMDSSRRWYWLANAWDNSRKNGLFDSRHSQCFANSWQYF